MKDVRVLCVSVACRMEDPHERACPDLLKLSHRNARELFAVGNSAAGRYEIK